MAELNGAVDWVRLHELVMRHNAHVEYFPIAPEPGAPGALGISVPKRSANQEGWLELRAILLALIRAHHASVIDMYSGSKLGEPDVEALRQRVLGGEA